MPLLRSAAIPRPSAQAPPEDDCPQVPPPEKDSNQHDTKAAPRELEMPSAPPQHHQAVIYGALQLYACMGVHLGEVVRVRPPHCT